MFGDSRYKKMPALDAFCELNRDVGRGNALKNFKLKVINQEYSRRVMSIA